VNLWLWWEVKKDRPLDLNPMVYMTLTERKLPFSYKQTKERDHSNITEVNKVDKLHNTLLFKPFVQCLTGSSL
jgi:hypothetical protein